MKLKFLCLEKYEVHQHTYVCVCVCACLCVVCKYVCGVCLCVMCMLQLFYHTKSVRGPHDLAFVVLFGTFPALSRFMAQDSGSFLYVACFSLDTSHHPPKGKLQAGVKQAPESHWSELIWSTEIWAAKSVVMDTSWEKKPLPRAVRTLALDKIPEWNLFSFPSLHGFSLCIQTADWNLVTDKEQSNI